MKVRPGEGRAPFEHRECFDFLADCLERHYFGHYRLHGLVGTWVLANHNKLKRDQVGALPLHLDAPASPLLTTGVVAERVRLPRVATALRDDESWARGVTHAQHPQ